MAQEKVNNGTGGGSELRTKRQWEAHAEQRVNKGDPPSDVTRELVKAGWSEAEAGDLVDNYRRRQRGKYTGLAVAGIVMSLFFGFVQYDLMNPKPGYYYPFRAEWDPALNLVLLVAFAVATAAVFRRLLKLMSTNFPTIGARRRGRPLA